MKRRRDPKATPKPLVSKYAMKVEERTPPTLLGLRLREAMKQERPHES